MSFWKDLGKGIFKISRDSGNAHKTVVISGHKLLDQTKDIVRTIDKGGHIRHYETETGKQVE